MGRDKVGIFFLMGSQCLYKIVSPAANYSDVFLFFFQSGKVLVPSIFVDSICPSLEILWQWIIQNQGDYFVTTNFLSPAPPAALIAISINYLKFHVLHTESNNQRAMPGIWLCTTRLQYFTSHLLKCLFSSVQPLVFI